MATSTAVPTWAATAAPDPSEVGKWSIPKDLGVVGVHAVLLRTGEVLFWDTIAPGQVGSTARLLDLRTGGIRSVNLPFPRDIYCSGSTVMPDGRVLVPGGVKEPLDGIRTAFVFDPATTTWSPAAPMAERRYYPSSVQMPDGSTLVLGGWETPGVYPTAMESFDPASGRWTTLPPSANSSGTLYPRVFVLPDGRVFQVGPERRSRLFDPGTATWTSGAPMIYGARYEGAAVLLPGLRRILTAGGGATESAVTATAEVIDLDGPSPRWRPTGSLNGPRKYHTLVVLADGSVLAVGGGKRLLYGEPVRTAERYDPGTGRWSEMAVQTAPRPYHSTALLLPDGRVLSAGSDGASRHRDTYEIYSPPYLFRGPRPGVASVPASIGYGRPFAVATPDAPDVARVALVRPGAVTHSVDFDQRYVDLGFRSGAGFVLATAPSTAAHAPPGWYLLFLVDSSGVPSVARFVQLS